MVVAGELVSYDIPAQDKKVRPERTRNLVLTRFHPGSCSDESNFVPGYKLKMYLAFIRIASE